MVDYEEEAGLEEEWQKGERGERKNVWFPPGYLSMYLYDGGNGQRAKHLNMRQEKGKEERVELPTHPREVDLKRVLEDLQIHA